MMRHFRPSTRWRWSAAIWLLLLLPVALAQRPPQPPRPIGERQIQPSLPAAPQANAPGAPAQNKPKTCEEVRRKARFGIYFDKVEIEKLVQTDGWFRQMLALQLRWTCRTSPEGNRSWA